MSTGPKSGSVSGLPRPQTSLVRTVSAALPNEILNQILANLHKRDLKVVRLAGDRHLESLAAPHLFVTAYIAARRGVIDVFQKMTNHPTIRHFIKEVVYDSSWFDPPDVAVPMPNGGYRFLKACSKSAWSKFFREQERIQKQELSQCLKIAFANLTHVKRVVFADLSRSAGFPGDTMYAEAAELPTAFPTILESQSESQMEPLLAHINSGSRTREIGLCCLIGPNEPECSSHRGVFRRQYGGLLDLLQILSTTTPPTFEELRLGDGQLCADEIEIQNISTPIGSSYGGIPNWLFAPATARALENTHYLIFQRLRKLHLTICFTSAPRISNVVHCTIPASLRTSGLGKLLSTADSLVDLRLSGQIDTGNLIFTEILGSKTWSKLRNLELKYFCATSRQLVDMFFRHAGSLKFVNLDYFNLIEGSWLGLDRIISTEIPKLAITAGYVWQKGELFEYQDESEDRPWLPRNKNDRLRSDMDELCSDQTEMNENRGGSGDVNAEGDNPADGDAHGDNDVIDHTGDIDDGESESSSEELEYSEGSDIFDDEDWRFM